MSCGTDSISDNDVENFDGNRFVSGFVSLELAHGAAVCDEEKFDEVAGTLLLYSAKETQPVDAAGLELSCLTDNKTFEWIENYAKTCIKGVAGGKAMRRTDERTNE